MTADPAELDLEEEVVPDAQATPGQAPEAPGSPADAPAEAPAEAAEQAPDEEVTGVIQGVDKRMGSYAEAVAMMDSLAKNHQFNLDTITKQEVVKGEVVLHCNSLYEYLKMVLTEPADQALVATNQDLLERLSSGNEEELRAAMADVEASPDKDWIKEKVSYEGSAVNVKGSDKKIVIMRDIPLRTLFIGGEDGKGRLKTPEETARGERDYQNTVKHEVQHVKYYNERGLQVQQILERRKAEGNLSPKEEEYLMVEFLTKDEVVAHMYNELTLEGNINWEGMKQNLRKGVYADQIAKPENLPRYEKTVDELVDKAKESFTQQGVAENPSAEGFDKAIDKVMADLIAYHPQEFASLGKI